MTQNTINNSASSLDVDNINLDGNTISSTDTNGNVIIAPDGTGSVSVTTSLDVDNLTVDGNTISSTDTNGNVIIAPDGTGSVSIESSAVVPTTDRVNSLGSVTNSWDKVFSNSITFDDGANNLKSYTENTSFTPTLAFGGVSTGVSYVSQVGTFTRIGNLIWVHISIHLSNKGSSVGSCTIEGLPFATNESTVYALRTAFVSFSGGHTYFIGASGNAATNINIQEVGGGVSFLNVPNTRVVNNSQFFLSGFFRTAT